MLDSSGNIPSALFVGNTIDMGFFDECMSTAEELGNESVNGKYCYAGLVIPLIQNASDSLVEEQVITKVFA